jgi:hypothetical protein
MKAQNISLAPEIFDRWWHFWPLSITINGCQVQPDVEMVQAVCEIIIINGLWETFFSNTTTCPLRTWWPPTSEVGAPTKRSYVVPMRWVVIHEYEVPGGALHLSSTELPRPWSPWESSPSRKNPHGGTGNQTRDLMISSQKLWPLDYEAGQDCEKLRERLSVYCLSLFICHYADLCVAKQISVCLPHARGFIFQNWKVTSSFTHLLVNC